MSTAKLYGIFGVLAVVAIILYMLLYQVDNTPVITVTTATTPASPKNATYVIEGQPVTLTNGLSVQPAAPGSATKVTTQYFGNEIITDLNGDNLGDSIFLLTQNTGGSGTFYYVVAALYTPSGYRGSQGLLLGDRIAPQNIERSQKPTTPLVFIVNYADRRPGDSFTTAPSVGKSIWIKLDTNTMQFGEVAQNFEGESK